MPPERQAAAVRAILARELRRRLADPAFVLLALVAPTVMALLLGHVVSPRSETFAARYVLADDDRGAPALSVLRGPIRSLYLTEVVRIVRAATQGEVLAAVEGGFADAGLYIPPAFSAAADHGRPVAVRVLGARSAAFETLVLASTLEGFGRGFEAVALAADLLLVPRSPAPDGAPDLPGGPGVISFEPAAVAALGAALADMPSPIVLREARTRDRMAEPRARHAASMASIAVFIAAFLGVAGVLADTSSGLLGRILVAGVRRGTLALAALLGGLLLGLVAMCVTGTATWLLLGQPWGESPGVLALCLALASVAAGVALLIVAGLGRADRAAALAGFAVLTFALLGGVLAPSADAPAHLAWLRHLSPHAWFLGGLNELAAGAPAAAALPSILVLLAAGALSAGVGLRVAMRRLSA